MTGTGSSSNPYPPKIKHFSHLHNLDLTTLDQTQAQKSCIACNFNIVSPQAYSCKQCDYVLHKSCAQMARTITHPAHHHSLKLLSVPKYHNGSFQCDACGFEGSHFSYHCDDCQFDMHGFCASMTLSDAFSSQFYSQIAALREAQAQNDPNQGLQQNQFSTQSRGLFTGTNNMNNMNQMNNGGVNMGIPQFGFPNFNNPLGLPNFGNPIFNNPNMAIPFMMQNHPFGNTNPYAMVPNLNNGFGLNMGNFGGRNGGGGLAGQICSGLLHGAMNELGGDLFGSIMGGMGWFQ